MVDFVKPNNDQASSKKDARKSLSTKRAWGRHLHSFLSGIKKFHSSLEGKRMHRKLGRFLATRNLLPKLDHNRSLLSLRQELKPTSTVSMREQKQLIIDQFDIDERMSMSESLVDGQPSIVDGKHVLGRVSGPFFLVNGISKNKRFYSRRLWENALDKMRKVLESGGSIGTVGHDGELVEKAIREGHVSHLVTKLWIDDSDPSKPIGMGEAVILGTPAGHTLYSLMKAGKKIPVSSRAVGCFKGKGPMGEDIIDEDSFEPETWDFVLNPGVETAYPSIKESRSEILETREETQMEPTMQKLTEERLALQADLSEALKTNESLNQKVQESEKTIATLRKIVGQYNKLIGSPEQATNLNEGLRKFLELEPLKSWFADMDGLDLLGGESGVRKLIGVTEAYAKLGSVKELKALKESKAQLDEKGSVEDVKQLMAVTEQYMALGTPKQLAENAKILAAYKKLGSLVDIKKVFGIAETYFKMGSPKKLQAKLEEAATIKDKQRATQKAAVAKKIAEHFDVSVKSVSEMLKGLPAPKVIEILKESHESKSLQNRYRVSEDKKSVRGQRPSKPQTIAEKLFESM